MSIGRIMSRISCIIFCHYKLGAVISVVEGQCPWEGL
jgi:hypothetical protein